MGLIIEPDGTVELLKGGNSANVVFVGGITETTVLSALRELGQIGRDQEVPPTIIADWLASVPDLLLSVPMDRWLELNSEMVQRAFDELVQRLG